MSECTVGHFLHHVFQGKIQARHGRGYSEISFIFFSQLNNRMPEYILVFGRLGISNTFLLYLPGHLIKQARCMPLGLIFSASSYRFTLHRFDVETV